MMADVIPLIFVDIDGVLATRKTLYRLGEFDPRCVHALNWLTDRIEAEIVVSSTWRLHWNLRGLRQLFRQQGCRAAVIASTPSSARGGGRYGITLASTRGDEIAAWLREHGNGRPYLILDDEGDLGSHHIQTDYEIGLTFEDVERALAILLPELVVG